MLALKKKNQKNNVDQKEERPRLREGQRDLVSREGQSRLRSVGIYGVVQVQVLHFYCVGVGIHCIVISNIS